MEDALMPWIGSLNCNFRLYSDGVSVTDPDGTVYDLTWQTARAARLGSFLKQEMRCSLYAVSECDTQMMDDLCEFLSPADPLLPRWKHIGGDNYFSGPYDGDAQDKNGFLYDSSKWQWDAFVNHNLPSGGTRSLLGATWTYLPTGDSIRLYTTHLSSQDPTGRPLQMARCLEIMKGEVCTFTGDLNAQSTVYNSKLAANQQGPRVQLDRAGWEEAPYAPGTLSFNSYNSSVPTGRIDYFGRSPEAVRAGRFAISAASFVPALSPVSGAVSAYGTDHNPTRANVSF
jgi:endonuclease/exonuclease/phosphatase family metal-dependent hydrolase